MSLLTCGVAPASRGMSDASICGRPIAAEAHLHSYDSQTQIRTVPFVFAKEERSNWQAPQPGNVCHSRASQKTRARRAVIQKTLTAQWPERRTSGVSRAIRLLCRQKCMSSPAKKWSGKVKTVSTYPPKGLFTKDPETIARSLASKKVSPKGPGSGMRMLTFFMNRAGKNLSASRKAALHKAKQLLSEWIKAARQRNNKAA
jgi:Protein of unknown function (DUF3175)